MLFRSQFLYLATAFLASFFLFFLLKFFVWIIFAVIIALIALAFTFVKYNGRSFAVLARSVFGYFWKPRTYVWSRDRRVPQGGILENLNLRLNTSSQPIAGERSFKLPFLQRFRSMKESYEVFRKVTGEKEVARRVDYR